MIYATKSPVPLLWYIPSGLRRFAGKLPSLLARRKIQLLVGARSTKVLLARLHYFAVADSENYSIAPRSTNTG